MKLLNAIWAATAAEACLFGAGFGLVSLAGFLNGWLDVVAQFAPVWFALSLAGGAIALAAIESGAAKVVVLALAATGLVSSGWLIAPELARNQS